MIRQLSLMAVAAVFALALFTSEPSAQGAPGCDPSFGGKYRVLQRRIPVPGDAGQYGACKDYGRWSGNSYKGFSNLPNGYWTYSAPHWYIWAQRTAGGTCDPSYGGKYVGFLRRLYIPQDQRQYGACRDYGRWASNSYKGFSNLPSGYWTYVAPYWYIWADKTQ